MKRLEKLWRRLAWSWKLRRIAPAESVDLPLTKIERAEWLWAMGRCAAAIRKRNEETIARVRDRLRREGLIK